MSVLTDLEMEHTPDSAWEECLQIIRNNISRQSFKTWFEPLKAINLEEVDGKLKLMIQLPSQFYLEWLQEHYFALIRRALNKVLGPNSVLAYSIGKR